MSVWLCPACGRRVPERVDQCRCGSTRPSPAAPRVEPAAPPAASPRATLALARISVFGVILLSGVVAGWRLADNRQAPAPATIAVAPRAVAKPPAAPPEIHTVVLPSERAQRNGESSVLPDQNTRAFTYPAAPSAPAVASLEDMISRAMPAVVRVETSSAYGTGVFD